MSFSTAVEANQEVVI